MSTILSSLGLSPLALAGIVGAIIAALGALWRTKAKSKAQGVAEEKARTDAANNEFVKEHRHEQDAVDRLGPDAVDRELSNWSPKR
jgi:hypothetical protein